MLRLPPPWPSRTSLTFPRPRPPRSPRTASVPLRAIEDGRTRWIVLAGVLVGLGFLTKQLQAFLVLPGIAAVYLVAAPVSLGRRLRDGLIAVAAMVVSAGW